MSPDLEALFNVIADSATSDVNHPERVFRVERFSYSGRGLEAEGFQSGETIWQVTFKPRGSYDSKSGYGRTVYEAAAVAAQIGLASQREIAAKKVDEGRTSVADGQDWLDKVAATQAALDTALGGVKL